MSGHGREKVAAGLEARALGHVDPERGPLDDKIPVWTTNANDDPTRPSHLTSPPSLSMDPRDKKRSSLIYSNGTLNGESHGMSSVASSVLPLHHSHHGQSSTSRRSATPPASTYFTTYAQDPDHAPVPGPEAQGHFAFSSTLVRRAPESPTAMRFDLSPIEGMFDRLRGAVGMGEEMDLGGDDGRSRPPAAHSEVTPSSKFAHMSIDVSLLRSFESHFSHVGLLVANCFRIPYIARLWSSVQ